MEKALSDSAVIDLTAALRFSGSMSSLRTILRELMGETDKDADAIERFCEQGNWTDYAVKVHGVKSAFTIAGAAEIPSLAANLERAAKSGDYDFCRIGTSRLCRLMREFKVEISPIVNNE